MERRETRRIQQAERRYDEPIKPLKNFCAFMLCRTFMWMSLEKLKLVVQRGDAAECP